MQRSVVDRRVRSRLTLLAWSAFVLSLRPLPAAAFGMAGGFGGGGMHAGGAHSGGFTGGHGFAHGGVPAARFGGMPGNSWHGAGVPFQHGGFAHGNFAHGSFAHGSFVHGSF